jgi:hypothetical protein
MERSGSGLRHVYGFRILSVYNRFSASSFSYQEKGYFLKLYTPPIPQGASSIIVSAARLFIGNLKVVKGY